MRNLLSISIWLIFLCAWIHNCNSSSPNNNQNEESTIPDSLLIAQCIKNVFSIDDSLGSVRNHACETIALSQTISNYTSALKKLNFKDCPEEFKKAFKDHWIAWDDMIPVVNNYPDLRGEMHDLFDQIEIGADSSAFNIKLKAIWDTWAIIEQNSK